MEEKIKLEFPKTIPMCCNQQMYPCGGVIGERPDGFNGDVEHQWRCEKCGKETTDILSSW